MAATSSYVYLFVEADGRAFKIGTSIDPKTRSFQLHNEIDYDLSLQFRFDGRQAAKAERTLHFLFRSSRQTRPRADGSTEWFDIDCLAMVKDFLWSMRDLVGWTEWSHVIPQTAAAPATATAVSTARFQSRKALDAAQRAVREAREQEQAMRRKRAAAELEAARVRLLTDCGMSVDQAKKPVGRKAKAKPAPVRSITLDEYRRLKAAGL